MKRKKSHAPCRCGLKDGICEEKLKQEDRARLDDGANMTQKEIASRLISIGKIEHNDVRTGEPWLGADLIDQDQLFELQEKFMDLLDELDHAAAVKAFPFKYKNAGGA